MTTSIRKTKTGTIFHIFCSIPNGNEVEKYPIGVARVELYVPNEWIDVRRDNASKLAEDYFPEISLSILEVPQKGNLPKRDWIYVIDPHDIDETLISEKLKMSRDEMDEGVALEICKALISIVNAHLRNAGFGFQIEA